MTNPNSPRPHYFNFAHLALPELFTRDAARLMRSLDDEGEEFLNYLWNSVSKYEDAALTVDEHIAVEMIDKGSLRIALITLPKPERPTEAYFAAPVFDPIEGISRYFTLEIGLNANSEPITSLGEWRGVQHIHLDTVENASKVAFLKAIDAQLAAED